MKKIFGLICAAFVLFCGSTYAETQSFSKNNLSDAFSNIEAWENKNENVKISENTISSLSSKAYICNREYRNSDELICFDLRINDYNDSWVGLLLRAENAEKAPWTGNACVLFVIKEDTIELQYYSGTAGGGLMTDVVENPIQAGKTAEIACGILKNGDKEQAVLFIDGKSIINRTSSASRNEGYFSVLCGNVDFEMKPSQKDKDYAVVCNAEILGKVENGEKLDVKYDVLSSGKSECVVRWYVSDEPEIIGAAASEGLQYELGESDLDKYITACVVCSGNEFKTAPVFFDSAKNYLKEKIVMKEDWFISYANGIQNQIDGDFSIAPMKREDRLYIPLRYVMESMGYEVLWDDAGRKVIARKGDSVIDIMPEMIYNNKSFADIAELERILSCGCVYDESSGIIIIGADDAEIGESVYRRILNYMYNGF